jgi:predicted dehydrogenase
MVGFEGGRTIQVEATRMSHVSVGRVFQLFGVDGAVDGTTISRFVRGEYKTREVVKPVDRRKGSDEYFFYEIEDFARAVAGEMEPDVSAADAYVFTRMLEALYASARNNRRTAIQL